MLPVLKNVLMVLSHTKLKIKSIIVSNVTHYVLLVPVLLQMIVQLVLKVLDYRVNNVLKTVLINNSIKMVNVLVANHHVFNALLLLFVHPVLINIIWLITHVLINALMVNMEMLNTINVSLVIELAQNVVDLLIKNVLLVLKD